MSTGPFPSTLERRAPTLAELQVELGAENANSLVSKIGELARAHGLGSHAGMNGTVDRVIGSLTMDERRLMSQGSYVPPRVEAIISAEAETAKSQQRQNEGAARKDNVITALGAAALMRMQDGHGWAGNGFGGAEGKANAAGVGSSSRANYQDIAYNSPQSLQMVTNGSYLSTPFAKTGMNFGTFNYLRSYDKSFTGQDILKAANDVKQLGFGPNDKRAMRNHATIRHYDNKPDATNDALQNFRKAIEGDKELDDLMRRREVATDPAEQKELDNKIAARKNHHVGQSGVKARIDDPKNHPKARKAIKDDIDMMMDKRRQQLKLKADPAAPKDPSETQAEKLLSRNELEHKNRAEQAALEETRARNGDRLTDAAKSRWDDGDEASPVKAENSRQQEKPIQVAEKTPGKPNSTASEKSTPDKASDKKQDKAPDKPSMHARSSKGAAPTLA